MSKDMIRPDVLLEDAAKLVFKEGMASTSLLQRKLLLGYNRAHRIMTQLEQHGIVGPDKGLHPREVLIVDEHVLV